MAQEWNTNFFDQGNVWSTDLQNIENALNTLRSMFSGLTQPANPVEGAPWMDTAKKVLKKYNGVAWDGLMHGDSAQKIWIYRDSAMAGWVVDSSVTDRVLAIKGGTTYATGGIVAGSWTISGLSAAAHNHKWYNYTSGSGDNSYSSTGETALILNGPNDMGYEIACYTTGGDTYVLSSDYYTSNTAPNVASTGAWRPAASVGTLQYLNI